MARKLKTYQTSLGFFDLAIAAPSMKAALAAWGSNSNLFHQGIAKEAKDPRVIAAAMARPGVVLKRAVGSTGRFVEHADLPTDLPSASNRKAGGHKAPAKRARSVAGRPVTDQRARKAAIEFEREEKRRDKERQREEAIAAKQRERRNAATSKAEAALEKGEREHAKRADVIETARAAVDKRWQAEQTRWGKQRKKLVDALHKARSQ
jgi:colicin import membrane protein